MAQIQLDYQESSYTPCAVVRSVKIGTEQVEAVILCTKEFIPASNVWPEGNLHKVAKQVARSALLIAGLGHFISFPDGDQEIEKLTKISPSARVYCTGDALLWLFGPSLVPKGVTSSLGAKAFSNSHNLDSLKADEISHEIVVTRRQLGTPVDGFDYPYLVDCVAGKAPFIFQAYKKSETMGTAIYRLDSAITKPGDTLSVGAASHFGSGCADVTTLQNVKASANDNSVFDDAVPVYRRKGGDAFDSKTTGARLYCILEKTMPYAEANPTKADIFIMTGITDPLLAADQAGAFDGTLLIRAVTRRIAHIAGHWSGYTEGMRRLWGTNTTANVSDTTSVAASATDWSKWYHPRTTSDVTRCFQMRREGPKLHEVSLLWHIFPGEHYSGDWNYDPSFTQTPSGSRAYWATTRPSPTKNKYGVGWKRGKGRDGNHPLAAKVVGTSEATNTYGTYQVRKVFGSFTDPTPGAGYGFVLSHPQIAPGFVCNVGKDAQLRACGFATRWAGIIRTPWIATDLAQTDAVHDLYKALIEDPMKTYYFEPLADCINSLGRGDFLGCLAAGVKFGTSPVAAGWRLVTKSFKKLFGGSSRSTSDLPVEGAIIP